MIENFMLNFFLLGSFFWGFLLCARLYMYTYIKIHVYQFFCFDLQIWHLHPLSSVSKCVVSKICHSKAEIKKLAVFRIIVVLYLIFTPISELCHCRSADPSAMRFDCPDGDPIIYFMTPPSIRDTGVRPVLVFLGWIKCSLTVSKKPNVHFCIMGEDSTW